MYQTGLQTIFKFDVWFCTPFKLWKRFVQSRFPNECCLNINLSSEDLINIVEMHLEDIQVILSVKNPKWVLFVSTKVWKTSLLKCIIIFIYRVVRQWWIVRKPPKTGHGGFQTASRFDHIQLKEVWNYQWFCLSNGNLRGRFLEVSGQSIIDGPHGNYKYDDAF